MPSHILQRVSVRPVQVLVAALLLAPLLAFAPQPGPASTGVAVAGGIVTSTTGAAMPGAAVDLYAWPSDAVLQALKPGQLVPTTLLATAITNSAGTYMLRVPVAKLKAAAVVSGYANLEIYSPLGGTWFTSYQTSSLPARPSTPAIVNLNPDIGVHCGTDPNNGYVYTFTGFAKERNRAHVWAIVGQGYIVKRKTHKHQTKGDYVGFNYDQGRDHSQVSGLGIGVSGYGFDAGYSGDGSHKSKSTRTEMYPNIYGNAWFRTLFRTGQFRGLCLGPQGVTVPYQHQHGQCPHTYTNDLGMMFYVHKCFWEIHSTGWFGGTSVAQPNHAPDTPRSNCAPHAANSGFSGDLGTAIEWSSGFELGAGLGLKGVDIKASFNSSAQTGYDANALMVFHFGRGHTSYLCGTNGSEASAAVIVERGNLPAR